MKLRRLAAMLIAAAMMVTFMPAMAFADDPGQSSKQKGEAPDVVGWVTGPSGQSAKWTPISVKSDGFWYYAVKAFWTSSDGLQTADSSKVYPADKLDENGYCTVDGVTIDSWYFGEFFEEYGPGKYSFEIKTVYRSSSEYEDSDLSNYRGDNFNGAKVIIKTLDGRGAETSYEGGSAMFSTPVHEQYNRIESGKYLTFKPNTQLSLEAQVYEGFSFEGYSFKNSQTTETNKKITYTLTDDDEITLTFKENEIVPITVVLGKGHEALARSLCSEIEKDDHYSCSLNSDDTELTIRRPGGIKIEGVMSFLSTAIRGSEAISEDEEKSFYGTGLKALSQYSGYDDFEREQENEWGKHILKEGLKAYAFWAKPAKTGIFNVDKPICGTEVTVKDSSYSYYGYEQTNGPVVRADKNSHFDISSMYSPDVSTEYWVKTKSLMDFMLGKNLYSGKIEGGKSYIAGFLVYPKFGYYVDYEFKESDPQPLGGDPDPYDPGMMPIPGDNPYERPDYPELKAEFSVNGEKVDAQILNVNSIYIAADVTADHDWGPWTVTKEPTTSEDGEETRTCKICGARETRAIPKPSVKQKKLLMATVRTKGRKSVRLTWNAMTDADGYDIFFARCNTKKKKYTCKYAGSVSGAKSTSWTKSSLKKGIPYKMYVKAYVVKDGKKSYFAKSPTVHAFASGSSKKYTNPKSVRVKKASAAIKAGKTYKIKASVVKLKKNKTLINTGHAPKLRYLSTDTSVATVSKSGKVKGKAAGSCKIYVYAVNGMKKAVKITVS
ncbi:MAG: Ig-like domain-containing protein [Mogibacterium sp.]|nr:Ig-like domain-containing protein [Mogibacterium sp.]